MNVTWKHLTGFVVVSGLIFALGLARGMNRMKTSRRYLPPPSAVPHETPGETLAEATFVNEVPAYPGVHEIAIGNYRDMFGFPTKAKKFSTEDKPERVYRFYEQAFLMKKYNVYPLDGTRFSAITALDPVRKRGYMVMILRQRNGRTMVFPTWTDYTAPNVIKPKMLPLDMGDQRPMLLSGDTRTNEMAVYTVPESPTMAYAKYGGQLESKGWTAAPLPKSIAKHAKSTQRVFQKGHQEMILVANKKGGQDTVLFCIVYPRM